jgi:hypothetical protein
MGKNMDLVLEAARRRGVELKVVQDAAWWIEQAEQQGPGGYDYSVVVAQIRGRPRHGLSRSPKQPNYLGQLWWYGRARCGCGCTSTPARLGGSPRRPGATHKRPSRRCRAAAR